MTEMTGQLQREIRQQRPFRSPAQEAALGLLHTADVVRRHLSAAVERFGVTHQQYNVLRILRGAKAVLPTYEIAARMVEEQPGITRLLDRLERKGLVSRERCAEDRRQVLCSITPEGLELLRTMDGPMDAAGDASVAMLTREEQKQLIRLQDKIRAGYR